MKGTVLFDVILSCSMLFSMIVVPLPPHALYIVGPNEGHQPSASTKHVQISGSSIAVTKAQ